MARKAADYITFNCDGVSEGFEITHKGYTIFVDYSARLSNDEMSGLGAAWACGIALGMYTRDVVDVYGARGIVESTMSADERAKKIAGWRHAVKSTIAYTA